MGGEHRPQQHRRGKGVAQREAEPRADHLREEEGEEAEDDAVLPVPVELVQIELDPHHEHQVEQPHRTEEHNGGAPREQAQAIRSHRRARDDEADHPRDPHPLEEERREQEDHHRQREDQHRVGDR